jgi:GH35 family endo-1,4-beta-xylanase
MKISAIALGISVLLAVSCGVSAENKSDTSLLPPDAAMKIQNTGQTSFLTGGKFQIVDVNGVPFAKALRFDIAKVPPNNWDVVATVKSEIPVGSGQKLLARFWIRGERKDGVADPAKVRVILEKRSGSRVKSLASELEVCPEWKKIELPFTAKEAMPEGDAAFGFHLGFAKQLIEIGDVDVVLTGERVPSPVPPKLPSPSEPGSLLGADLASQFQMQINTGDKGMASLEVVPVTGQNFDKVFRIKINKQPTNDQSWAVELKTRAVDAIKTGDVCAMEFYVRCPESDFESGDGRLTCFVQEGKAPYSKPLASKINVGREWLRVQQPFIGTINFAPGEAHVGFHLAFARQILEIGGIRLINYKDTKKLADLPLFPRLTYPGRELDASWRKAAQERIEKIRKGDMTIQVVDETGKPIPDAQVKVEMRKHSFTFSTAIGTHVLDKKDDNGRKYAETLRRLFNGVVIENTFKGADWYNPVIRERGVRWAKLLHDEGYFDQRGHWLSMGVFEHTSGGLSPEKIKAMKSDPAALLQYMKTYADEVLGAVGTDITDWDAINHLTAYWGTKVDALYGGLDVYVEFLKYLKSKYPKLMLCVNESSYMDEYFRRIQYLTDHGVVPDSIGFMSHYSDAKIPTPEELLAILDRFAVFGKPLRATEFDFGSNDEQLEADFTRDFLTAFFSHPSVDKIVFWGFWEKAHWRPETAMFRADWTEKPSGKAYEELVLKSWWTKIDGKSNDKGQFKVRGFLGDYEVTVEKDEKKKTIPLLLKKEGTTVSVKF